jgi:hypothetical protein
MANPDSDDHGQAPEVGRTTHLANGADMTLIDYQADEDGDTFTWSMEWPNNP